MYSIENETLKIEIDAKGAELKSVYNKPASLEYLWGANPAYWGKTAPVLFPIVGTLKDNTYMYQGKAYTLPRHGFARDQVFTVAAQAADQITFSISSNEETLKLFPFSFSFSIQYALVANALTVGYRVRNTGDAPMFFSVGGHPAFNVPLVGGTAYTDYKLVFEKEETAGRWPISKEGLIEDHSISVLQHTRELPLSKELFQKDALVFKHLQSGFVQLVSDKTTHGLQFTFAGFPFLGLWAAPGADFVCIEPWCGIADSVQTDQQLAHKEGIHQLAGSEEFRVHWRADFF